LLVNLPLFFKVGQDEYWPIFKITGFLNMGHDNLKASSSYIGIPFPDLAQNVSWANSRFLVERLVQKIIKIII
jgi:hypothetical protein